MKSPLQLLIRAFLFVSTLLLFAACVSTGRDRVDMKAAAEANTDLGLAYLSEGSPDRAFEVLKRAVDQNPRQANAHVGLAYIYLQRGDYVESEKAYKRALSIEPASASIRNNYAILLCETGKYKKAIELFSEAVTTVGYRTPAAAANNAATCARESGDLLLARRWARKALSISPGYPSALLEMAEVELAAGSPDAAQEWLQNYKRSVPAEAFQDAKTLRLSYLIALEQGDTAAANNYARELRQNRLGSGASRQSEFGTDGN